MPAEKYSGNGPGSAINGVTGSGNRFDDGVEWLGFEGHDFEAVVDLGNKTSVSKVSS
jgi:hexosaminidase